MRSLIFTFALSLGLISTPALADQKLLKAMQDAGATFTEAEVSAIKDAKCIPEKKDDTELSPSCQSTVDLIAQLVSTYATNDQMVEAILRGAVESNPELTTQIADASILAAPDAVALIAGLMTEIAPTAAGTPPGLAIARTVANPNNNIPTPSGGGGSSSPN